MTADLRPRLFVFEPRRTGHPLRAGWLAAGLVAGLAAMAHDGAFAHQAAKDSPTLRSQPVAAHPAFSKPAPEHLPPPKMLRAFLAELGQTRRAQSFCFVQQSFPPSNADPEGFALVWMEWTTGSRLYRLQVRAPQPSGARGAPNAAQDDDAASRGMGLANGKSVNFKTDVVADEAAVGSSTYLVTRAWVDRIRDQCRRIGTVVRLAAPRTAGR